MGYIPRAIEPFLLEAFRHYPAVLLTGPRQSGKTTTLRHLFPSLNYVLIDEPAQAELANRDPELFLREHPDPVILDEIQEAPHLFNYLKARIDRDRSQKGRYLLTGSQQFALMQGVTESLAGRIAVFEMLPLALAERPAQDFSPLGLMQALVRGGFPDLIASPDQSAAPWYSSYIKTYLERDVRALRNIADLMEFQRFMQLMAGRTAQLLDLTGVSRELGVAVNTIKGWLRVLEATMQAARLAPFHRNRGKRLVKTPKMYFQETGLVCHLIALRDADHALHGPFSGALFETAIFNEIMRAFLERALLPSVSFWRTKLGEEVDFVLEIGGNLIAIEAKLAQTVKPAMARGLETFCDLYPETREAYLVSLSEQSVPLSRRVNAISLAQFCQRLPEWIS